MIKLTHQDRRSREYTEQAAHCGEVIAIRLLEIWSTGTEHIRIQSKEFTGSAQLRFNATGASISLQVAGAWTESVSVGFDRMLGDEEDPTPWGYRLHSLSFNHDADQDQTVDNYIAAIQFSRDLCKALNSRPEHFQQMIEAVKARHAAEVEARRKQNEEAREKAIDRLNGDGYTRICSLKDAQGKIRSLVEEARQIWPKEVCYKLESVRSDGTTDHRLLWVACAPEKGSRSKVEITSEKGQGLITRGPKQAADYMSQDPKCWIKRAQV